MDSCSGAGYDHEPISGGIGISGGMRGMGSKGFFGSLFDLSFSSLVTPKVIKFIYVLTLIVIGLVALLFVVAAFQSSSGAGVVTLFILAPVASLFYIVYTRVFLEFFIAIFQIAQSNAELVALKRIELGLGETPPAEPTATVED